MQLHNITLCQLLSTIVDLRSYFRSNVVHHLRNKHKGMAVKVREADDSTKQTGKNRVRLVYT